MSSINDLLDAAQKLKDEANIFYKDGEYKKAIAKYTKIFPITNSVYAGKLPMEGLSELGSSGGEAAPTKEQVERAKKLRIDANHNCAMAYEKMNLPNKAIDFIERILDFDPDNAKAIYRRGHLALMLNDMDIAERDLTKSLVSFPKDANVSADCKSLKLKLKEQEVQRVAKTKAMYGGIFSKRGGGASQHPPVVNSPVKLSKPLKLSAVPVVEEKNNSTNEFTGVGV